MRKKQHLWVCAALDLDESDVVPSTRERLMEVSEYQAQMAVDAGVDAIEVGTGLCYSMGYEAVSRIRAVVGPDFPVIADLKAQDGPGNFFRHSRRFGADYATVSAVNNDGGLTTALDAKNACGIRVIADLFGVSAGEMVGRAEKCEALGADIVLVHFGYDERMRKTIPGRRSADYVKEVSDAVNVPVFVEVNEPEEAERAIRDGADGIVFSDILKDHSRKTFEGVREFIAHIRRCERAERG